MGAFRSMIRLPGLFLCLLIVCCASMLRIRVDADPRVDLSSYHTFGFLEPLTTDKVDYSTLLSLRLKEATRRELEKRGYRYTQSNPDLLVNFNVNIMQRQELRADPAPVHYGYYRYRFGLYDPWPDYPYDIYTVNYKVGTLIIDLVDAARKQLVWQGLAEGHVTEKILNNPAPAIDRSVTQIFARYPIPPRKP